MWEYLIKFEGTLDAIAMWEDGYYIVDIKTAKQRRTETMLYSKYQCVFYVALRSLVMWIEQGQMKFEYRVFIKNKSKWVMQRMTRMIDIEDARKQLFKYLRAYAEKWKLQSLEKK
jgi:hypothetical protein